MVAVDDAVQRENRSAAQVQAVHEDDKSHQQRHAMRSERFRPERRGTVRGLGVRRIRQHSGHRGIFCNSDFALIVRVIARFS